MERMTVTCPSCNKSFEVSASILKITCNFCGTVFSLSMIKDNQLKSEGLEINSKFYFDKAVDALTSKVTTMLNTSEVLTKQKYPQAFSDYYNEICESFKYFKQACNLYAGENNEIVLDYVKAFSTKIKKNASCDNFNLLKGADVENVIYLYIAFAVPSILKFETEYSDDLADALLQTWNSEYKKRKIGKSTFESISQGFRTKLCFITTAVCSTLGLPDDCHELQSFRKFRDDYLLKQPGGKEQVREYYLIAPMIVDAIDTSSEKDRVYNDIWDNYLSKCFAMYKQHDYERCRETYIEMVNILNNKWLS